MSVEKFLSPNDLWNDGKERGNISWWFNTKTDGVDLPEFKCVNCGKNLFYEKPERFCGDCGSLMVNYFMAEEEYNHVLEQRRSGNDFSGN